VTHKRPAQTPPIARMLPSDRSCSESSGYRDMPGVPSVHLYPELRPILKECPYKSPYNFLRALPCLRVHLFQRIASGQMHLPNRQSESALTGPPAAVRNGTRRRAWYAPQSDKISV